MPEAIYLCVYAFIIYCQLLQYFQYLFMLVLCHSHPFLTIHFVIYTHMEVYCRNKDHNFVEIWRIAWDLMRLRPSKSVAQWKWCPGKRCPPQMVKQDGDSLVHIPIRQTIWVRQWPYSPMRNDILCSIIGFELSSPTHWAYDEMVASIYFNI